MDRFVSMGSSLSFMFEIIFILFIIISFAYVH